MNIYEIIVAITIHRLLKGILQMAQARRTDG